VRSKQGQAGPARARLGPSSPIDESVAVLDLAVGDVVVYASHGLGFVEARRAGGGDLPETVVLVLDSGLRVTLPVARAQGALRSPSGEAELEEVRRTLRTDAAPRVEPWSKRFQATREKVNVGEAAGLAEVVRDGADRDRELARGGGARAATAPAERGLYLQARKLLTAEIAFARGIDTADADMWIAEQIEQNTQG